MESKRNCFEHLGFWLVTQFPHLLHRIFSPGSGITLPRFHVPNLTYFSSENHLRGAGLLVQEVGLPRS